MVRATGVFESGVIRLNEAVDLPAGAEVDVTIEPRCEKSIEEQRHEAVLAILAEKPVDIRPLTVRDLIEYGRER